MKGVDFFNSDPFTLGVELEFQILDADSLDLVPRAGNILEKVPERHRKNVVPEFFQSMVEVQTGICHTVREVGVDLRRTVLSAEKAAETCGCFLFASGLHPFAELKEQRVTNGERYLRIMDDLQYVGRRFIAEGLHVHVGMADKETAIVVFGAIQAYLPLLLALSASSPYFRGFDTGLCSYRTKLFDALPLAGLADYFGSWPEYEHEIMMLKERHVIKEIRDLWWNVRLSPGFGTVEIRICDMPSRFSDILALTAVIQAFTSALIQGGVEAKRISPQILRYNKWQAARYGLDGWFNDPLGFLSSSRKTLRQSVRALMMKLAPVMTQFGSDEWAGRLDYILKNGTSADRQRNLVAEHGDFDAMIVRINKEFWS